MKRLPVLGALQRSSSAAFSSQRPGAAALRTAAASVLVALLMGLAACGSAPKKPQPTALKAPANLLDVKLQWSARVGAGDDFVAPVVVGGRLFVASAGGAVAAIDPANGKDLWRLDLKAPLGAGVGSDGQTVAVITRENELIALSEGREVWRVSLGARSFTAPLVAGQRVFVLTADRRVLAFDGQNGARLWSQSRPGEPLVLGQSGVLLAVGDTLVAGLSARLSGLNPLNGEVRWEAPLANARGTNEVERLVDLVSPVSRVGDSVCARSFGAAVGCVDTTRGSVVWSKRAAGSSGLHGDETFVFGAETDGRVLAWQRASGDLAWENSHLRYRELTAPLALGRAVVVGDKNGLVHVLSRSDGSELNRLSTDGSAIIGAPVLAGPVLVVQTRAGNLYAWRPQ